VKKNTQNNQPNTFYKRIENLSNIIFTDKETQLLIKGLKYNLHYKWKDWIQTLAIEVEITINQLNPNEQAYMRQNVTNKLQTLIVKGKMQKERTTTYRMK
jgi:hypothetical protein